MVRQSNVVQSGGSPNQTSHVPLRGDYGLEHKPSACTTPRTYQVPAATYGGRQVCGRSDEWVQERDGRSERQESPISKFNSRPIHHADSISVVKAIRRRKNDHVFAKDADDEMLLLDSAPVPDRRADQAHTQPRHMLSTEKQRRLAKKSGSETEDEDDHLLLGVVTAPDPDSANASALPTPNRSMSPDLEIDEREEGRIIGFSYPLGDWRKNLAEGDVVSKAVEDMGYAIREIVNRPFAERRHGEMIECMREMRETCLREDEIDEWNGCVTNGKMWQF